MYSLDALYEVYQRFYDRFGTSFTPEHTILLRGHVRYIPGVGPGSRHHLPDGCGRGILDPVVEPADEITWARFCKQCVTGLTLPASGAVASLFGAVENLLTVVKDLGGEVRENPGGPFATVGDLLSRSKFPLPAADHPRDWYRFWEALNQLWSNDIPWDVVKWTHRYLPTWGTWLSNFRTSAENAVTRWAEDREVFTNLMYARARFAMIGHPDFRRKGEIPLNPEERSQAHWPHGNVLTLPAKRDAAIASHHLAGMDPTDFSTVDDYVDALEVRLEKVGYDLLCEQVDAELDAKWEGDNTSLVWNGEEPSSSRYLPLGGWVFPALVLPEVGGAEVGFGTIAQAHAAGGLTTFSLIWKTASSVDSSAKWETKLRAAQAALNPAGRSAGSV